MIRLTLFILFSLIALHSSGLAQNEVWIGTVTKISVEKNTEEVLVKFKIEEYTSEGKFENFDESSVVFTNRDKNFKQWTINLDNVGAGTYNKQKYVYKNKQMMAISEIEVSEQPGSFSNASRSQSKGGKSITSAKLIVTGYVPIYVYLKKVDKKNTSSVFVTFGITDKIPEEQLSDGQNESKLEFSVSDFEKQRPVGNLLTNFNARKLPDTVQSHLKRLNEMPKGTFVTLIYKVKYYDPSSLKSQLDQIKSTLGQVNFLEAASQIIIRDRSEYVMEMLQLLVALDEPVPQVIIDVQIVERNVQEGRDFASSFSYLRKNGTGYGGGIGYAPERNNMSGVYSHLSDDLLENLQANINMEIKKGRANLKTTTRLICKNRQVAQFNTGNSIPYYQLYEINEDDNDLFWRSHEKSKSQTENDVDDGGSKTSTTNKNRYHRDYRYDQQEQKENRKWKVNFIKTGVTLWVQPYIKNSRLVELAIKPSYSEITGMASYTDIPVLSDRSVDTSLTVRSGDTLLIAGLFYEKEIKMHKGIPLLMDIPWIGGIFSKEISSKEQTEIIFVLTVNIQYPN